VDVFAFAQAIDAGSQAFKLSYWVSTGPWTQNAPIWVQLDSYDVSDKLLGSFAGPSTTNAQSWKQLSGTTIVPPHTRRVRVRLMASASDNRQGKRIAVSCVLCFKKIVWIAFSSWLLSVCVASFDDISLSAGLPTPGEFCDSALALTLKGAAINGNLAGVFPVMYDVCGGSSYAQYMWYAVNITVL
jgi:hypothetical protein